MFLTTFVDKRGSSCRGKCPEGKRKLLRVRGSSYGGFELPRVKLQ